MGVGGCKGLVWFLFQLPFLHFSVIPAVSEKAEAGEEEVGFKKGI